MASIPDVIAKALGKAGKAINVVGSRIPTPVKYAMGVIPSITTFGAIPMDIFAKERGIGEQLENIGGQPLARENPVEAEIKTFERTGQFSSSNLGREFQRQQTQQQTTGKVGQQTTPVIQSKDFSPAELAGMTGLPESEMWHGKKVNIGGVQYEVRDTGKGTRTLVPVSSSGSNQSSSQRSPEDIANEAVKRAGETGTTSLLSDDTLNKIIEDVRERGLSVAEAMERRQREAAEERWRLINENLQRQKGEIAEEAKRQRGLVEEEEALYRPRIEARKAEELETIGKQRELSERELLQMKDDLGRSFMDTSRKLQAQLRAAGVASSGFAVGEEAKLLRNFNQNLDIIAVKHKDILEELDRAHRETTRFYNDKLADLEFETRKRKSDIDTWERQQIAAIQANENLNLADKLDRIAAAIDRADQVRLQVEQNYNNQKLALAQWQRELQLKMALAAQYAAQDKINSAYKQLQATRQLFQDAMANAWAGVWQPAGEGGWTLYSPTYAGYVPIGTYDEERKKEIEGKKMEPAQNIYGLLQQSLGGEAGGASW